MMAYPPSVEDCILHAFGQGMNIGVLTIIKNGGDNSSSGPAITLTFSCGTSTAAVGAFNS